MVGTWARQPLKPALLIRVLHHYIIVNQVTNVTLSRGASWRERRARLHSKLTHGSFFLNN